ncbi:hypothetical protein GCM10009754_33550 [Amycolatopsis minnesotensis]|uniref:Uncharacterized protein n=1 Tax=Amycolatopsis minnesotensis TaxID=337894 RepID=A0ABN2QY44_9PSEU
MLNASAVPANTAKPARDFLGAINILLDQSRVENVREGDAQWNRSTWNHGARVIPAATDQGWLLTKAPGNSTLVI